MRWFLAPALCLAIFALACYGSNSRTARVEDEPCTNDATATAVISNSGTARASGTRDFASAFQVPDTELECRLRIALLRSEDLPGWKDDELQGSGPHVRAGFREQPFDLRATCGAPANSFVGGLSAAFQRVGEDSLLAERVIAFDRGNAARFMQGVRRNCALKLARAPDEYEPASATSFGDESLAVKWQWPDGTSGDAIFIRRGDVVVMVQLIYPETSGTSIQAIAARVDEGLASIGTIPGPTAVAGEGCTPPSTPTPGASTERLQRALLKLDDMPESWGPHLLTKCGLIDGEGACKDTGFEPHQPTAVSSIMFDGRESFVRQDVEEWPAGSADAEIQRIRDRLSVPFECDATIGSTDFKWQLAIVDLPGLPEGAVATRLLTIGLGTGSSREVLIYGVALARGDLVARLFYAPPELTLNGAEFGRDISPDVMRLLEELLTPMVVSAERKLSAAAE